MEGWGGVRVGGIWEVEGVVDGHQFEANLGVFVYYRQARRSGEICSNFPTSAHLCNLCPCVLCVLLNA